MVWEKRHREAARRLVRDLGGARAGERVCIVCDAGTEAIGRLLLGEAKALDCISRLEVAPEAKVHGEEPPAPIAAAMSESHLILGIRTKSMAHTRARQDACAKGARYLSLAEYSPEMLLHPALAIDYPRSAKGAREVADRFSRGKEVRVVSPGGTDITLKIAGREGNYCPGFVDATNRLGSPPDIEANVSPVETESRGVALIDGSIAYPGFGVLEKPIRLEIEGGAIAKIEGDPAVVEKLESLFSKYGPKSRVLAEFGIGFNEAAVLCGNMLLDEGCRGTFHFGFGSNSTVGGTNVVGFHLDFIFRATEFYVDGEKITIPKTPQ